MKLSEQQKYELVQYIIDLYKNGIIDKNGKYTSLGNQKQDEAGSTTFLYCVSGEPPLDKYIEENNMVELLKYATSIWILFDKERCSWGWLFQLLNNNHINNNDKFEEILALNRKMYGIDRVKTSLEKAAELLADDEFEDI